MTHDPLREALEQARTILKGPHYQGGASLMAIGEAYSVVNKALTASAPKGEPCAYADWGQIVQCLLRTMDHPHKGENSTEQAVRMATELCRKYPAAPPAARWDEVMSNCEDFLADIVGGAQVTERSVQHAKELREGIAALRREAPAPEGVVKDDLDAKIAALAHRFWSIHPSAIAAKNLTREQFYAQEMTKLIKAVRG